jgi:hypothetical protein
VEWGENFVNRDRKRKRIKNPPPYPQPFPPGEQGSLSFSSSIVIDDHYQSQTTIDNKHKQLSSTPVNDNHF